MRNIDKFIKWDPQQGRYLPIAWKRQVLPAWLYFTATDLTGVKTIQAAGVPTSLVNYKQPYFSLEGQDQSLGMPLEIRSMLFADFTDTTPLANFTVFFNLLGDVRNLMNRPIHVRTMVGTSQTPAILREPFYLISQQDILVSLAKVAGAATTMEMFMHGAQYYPWATDMILQTQAKQTMTSLLRKWLNRRSYVLPFWLTTDTDVTGLAAGAQVDSFAKIGEDGHYEIFGHAGFAVTAAGAIAPVSYEISEVKTKQTLSNGAPTFVNGTGLLNALGYFPTIYHAPYMLPAGSRLRIRFTNLDVVAVSVFFTFFGRRIYAPFRNIPEVLQDTAVIQTPADTTNLMEPEPVGSEALNA